MSERDGSADPANDRLLRPRSKLRNSNIRDEMPPTVEACPRHGGSGGSGDSKSVTVGAYYPKPKAGSGGRMGGGGLIKTGTVGVQVGGLRARATHGVKATLEPVYGLDKVCTRPPSSRVN